jgi:quinoprotein glucose dehydrogenase
LQLNPIFAPMLIKIRQLLPLTPVLVILISCHSSAPDRYKTWNVYGGTRDAAHYSSLTQIDTNNVNRLQVAWVYHTGDADSAAHTQIQCNPIVIQGTLFGLSPKMKLFAADAATGQVKWIFDPMEAPRADTHAVVKKMMGSLNTGRGITYWTDGKDDQRLFYTAGPKLICVNAVSGKIIPEFGDHGEVDLHNGLGRDVQNQWITSNTPGIIFKDLLIVGSRVAEDATAAPGHIRAYDVRTGAQRWIFHTIPQPGEWGYDAWADKDAWKHLGSGNNWSGMSLDEERGIVFVPTGSVAFDFWGGKRVGNNLFGNCDIALDAATGKRIWHFQTIHHDLWDRDLPNAPILVHIKKDGTETDAIAQTTKTGFVYLLDRLTGKPLYPVEEKPVPTNSELAGEKPWPTQPIPTFPKPFVRQSFNESDLNPYLPDSSLQEIRARLKAYRHDNIFDLPSKEGTVIFPGTDGGAEWGGPAYDPNTGLLYVNANEMAWILTMVDVSPEIPAQETYQQAGSRIYQHNCMACHGPDRKGSGNYPSLVNINRKYSDTSLHGLLLSGRGMMPAFTHLSDEEKDAVASFILENNNNRGKKFVAPKQINDPYLQIPYASTGYTKFLTRDGIPAVRPPWGTLTAINLNTGETVWKDTLGDNPAMKAKGIHSGTENYGGPVVTAGGLLFIAATSDSKLRAYNKRSGQLLWEVDLPAPGFATPAVYESGGREFLVIACGGGKLGQRSGDSYIAYALPAGQ